MTLREICLFLIFAVPLGLLIIWLGDRLCDLIDYLFGDD